MQLIQSKKVFTEKEILMLVTVSLEVINDIHLVTIEVTLGEIIGQSWSKGNAGVIELGLLGYQ